MNINRLNLSSNYNMLLPKQSWNQQALNLLSGKKTTKTDAYIPSMAVQKNNTSKLVNGIKISSSIFDTVNFEYDKTREHQGILSVGDVCFKKDEMPQVDESRCSEIKAKNNAVVINSGNYYKFTDKDGKTHAMACAYGMLSQLNSNTCRGIIDEASYDRGQFWNLLAQDGTYMSMYYSHDEQKQILNEAGISEGFFSVQVDSKKQEYYYSNGNCGVAVSKSRYDADYNRFMSGESVLKDFKVGSVFKIEGKKYVLGKDKKLDIPYGADLYTMEYPPASQHETKW